MKNENKIKDKKIQFYLPVKTASGWRRSYPYSQTMYNGGGLWAYVRTKTQYEKTQSNMAIEKETLECRLNYNPIINQEYKAVYNGKIYDVSLPDGFEWYLDDTKFTLTSSADNTAYEGDIYE